MGTSGSLRPVAPREERARGVTNAAGDVVFTWTAGAFTAPPVVTFGVEAAAGFRSARISANTAAATTVHVDASAGITLLGIGVLAVGVNAAGVTVHAYAVAAP